MTGRSSSTGSSTTGSTPPWQQDESGSESFGSWLKKERRARSIDLEQIAEHTKISAGILEALENDNTQALPARVFVRGFLRQYARFVGLDPEHVVSLYPGLDEPLPESEVPRLRTSAEPNRALWPSVTIGVLVLVGAAGYWIYGGASDAAPEVAEDGSVESAGGFEPEGVTVADQARDATAPAGEAPTTAEVRDGNQRAAASAGSVPIRVTIDFVEDCWVESSVDGRRQISTLYAKGESLRLNAQESVRVFLGNFTGAEVHINDHAYSWPAGETGDTRELVVDAAFIAALTDTGDASDEAAPIS